MKILIVHSCFSSKEVRGSEIIAQDTYKILKEYGHEVYYFATNKKPYIENADWTKFFPTFYPKFNIKKLWNVEAEQNLAKMLDSVRPDIIHVHGTNEFSYSIFKPIIKRNIPVVMTVHDAGFLCPARYGWDNNKKTYCKKCSGLNTLPIIFNNCSISKNKLADYKNALINFIEKFSGYNKKINKFITPSQALADYIQNKDITNGKIKVISNFLNNDFVNQVELSNNMDYFLYVGTLGDYKGVNVLLEAIKELPKDIPFKIIGSGPNENKYKEFVKENNLQNVEFLGNLDRNEIIKYYANSISLIVPSNYFENFPTTNMESFINGKPVIASNIGGIPEQVEHNKTGLLFEPANVEQLKECILKYCNNKDLVIEHGKNAYEKARTQYTEERYYDELMKVYEEVLNARKKY